jgi:hypothetical protein
MMCVLSGRAILRGKSGTRTATSCGATVARIAHSTNWITQSAIIPRWRRTFDIDFALHAGFHLGLGDVDWDEFRCLKALRIERDRFQKEQTDKLRRQQ